MRALLALATLLAGCPKALPPTLVPDRVLSYETADGWTNTLRHYPGEGPPVLLVHGMAANHLNWDFREETSFIPRLVEAGFDVWVPTLRGDPGATHPSRKAARTYTFDDHARYDLPAAVDRVLAATGEDDLLWIGHSMGGMLLYTALSHYPHKVRAGVTIASPGVFEHPLKVHRTAAHAGWLVSGPGVLPMRGLARFALAIGLTPLIERQVATHDSMRRDLLRAMAVAVLEPVPKPMARQALDWVRQGAFTTEDGHPWLTPADVPLLLMAGPEDGVVSERDVAATCDRFPDCRYVQLSEANGFSHDYGHVDPVVGRMAAIEVLPRVLDFLEAHAGRTSPAWGALAPPPPVGAPDAATADAAP